MKQVPRAIVVAVALSLTACGGDAPAAPEANRATTTTVPSIPMEDGPPLEAGTYRVSSEGRAGPDPLQWSIVDFTITIPEGWIGHTGHYLESERFGFYPVLIDEIYADPCEGERGAVVTVGLEVNDLVDALAAQPGTVTTEPVETTIGGLPATHIDIEVPDGADLSACHLADYGPPGLQLWFSDRSDKYLVLMPGSTAGVNVIDVDGERQVFLTYRSADASDDDLDELQAILDSIRIR